MIVKTPRSIHSQLILFYSLSIISILLVFALAFYWETQNVMQQADINFVTEEANTIQTIMNDTTVDDVLLMKAIVTHPVRTRNSLYRYYVRLFDKNGKVILETPDLNEITPPPTAKQLPQDVVGQYQSYNLNDVNYLTYVTRIRSLDDQFIGWVQIVLDTSYQHSITHDRRIFIGLLVIGLLFSLVVGRVVTDKGLKSLDELTDTVQKIRTSSLDHRVDPKAMPKELQSLGIAFNQMLDRIEISFSRMHQMSADMSHELRTPINNLIGQTELLLSYAHNEVDSRNVQASNLEELQRMASLIENILFLARAESQRPDVETHTIDVASEVAKVCEYYQALADDKQISLKYIGNATVHFNQIMFRRMLTNLISNALKYSKPQGEVSVIVNDEGAEVIITVADNGIGIDAEHLPRIFDRFYRVDDSRSAQISGTGLGLAIVKSILDLHHGRIYVMSDVGIGTAIKITLVK